MSAAGLKIQSDAGKQPNFLQHHPAVKDFDISWLNTDD